jgi:hypothetical protein
VLPSDELLRAEIVLPADKLLPAGKLRLRLR